MIPATVAAAWGFSADAIIPLAGGLINQTFVVGDAEIIRDPDSGEVLDSSIKEVARLEVSQVKEKLSICNVTSGKATGVRKGMAVHTNP